MKIICNTNGSNNDSYICSFLSYHYYMLFFLTFCFYLGVSVLTYISYILSHKVEVIS